MNTHASFPSQAAAADDGAALSASLRPITVLNVEDFEPSRFLRSRVFKSAGYHVVEADTAGSALMTASQRVISLALIDVHLPDGNGIALCETLKRLNPALPVVLISAVSSSDEAQQAGIAAGADLYLTEPIASDALLRSVNEALTGNVSRIQSNAWIVTDLQGLILDVSPEAASMLSGTARGLQHRSLLIFFDQDRAVWRDAMLRAGRGERILRAGRLRPKERRPITVRAEILPTRDDMPPALVWRFCTQG